MSSSKKIRSAIRLADKKFMKAKAVQRNRNIFDIDQIDNFENMQERRRRTPYKTLLHSQIDQKFDQNFMNSTAVNSFKLQQDIEKHKQKISSANSRINSKKNTKYIYFNCQEESELNQNEGVAHKQIRGVSMDKMITRQYRSSLGQKTNVNQSRFLNYNLMTPKGNLVNFQKYISRQQLQKLRIQTVPDSNPDIPIIYEKFAYDSSNFRVNWQYKRQKWPRGPIFFKIHKQNSVNLYQIPDEKIQNARQKVTSKWNKTFTNFNKMQSKQDKSQFQRTFYSTNMDFRQKKQQPQHVGKRIKIKQNKKYDEFERQQLCDVKYFRLYPQTKGRKPRLHTS